MSVRSFRSVFMVGGVAAAALSCYLVSLRVASERASLESVETEIVLAQRDIRLLQTEIGTRGRLAQLERWNVKVLLLSAPSADQFVADSFQLARLTAPEPKPVVEAPVVYASAPAEPEPGVLPPTEAQASAPASKMTLMHEASLKPPAARATGDKPAGRTAGKKPAAAKAPSLQAATAKAKPATAKPAASSTATAKKSAPAAKAKPAPAKLAQAVTSTTRSTSKDSGKTR